MKNIFFLRHSKSSWDDFALKDFDRPLSTRGIQDADLMGNFFKSKKISLDKVLSSPSKRTTETVDHFFGKKAPDIEYVDGLYHAQTEKILDILFGIDSTVGSIMIVGPLLARFGKGYIPKPIIFLSFIDKFSTCGLSWIAISDEWHQIKQGCGELKFFFKPSQLR